MNLDKAALTAEDRRLVEAWEALFSHPAWVLVKRRYRERWKATIGDLESAETMKDLGIAKGSRDVLYDIVDLEKVVEAEIGSRYEAPAQAEGLDDAVTDTWRG